MNLNRCQAGRRPIASGRAADERRDSLEPARRAGGRALLLGGGLRAAPPPGRELEFWSLELSPKFDTYITSVIAAWEALHPGIKGALDRPALGIGGAQAAGGGVSPERHRDVVNLNPLFAANLASKGGLLALDPLLPPGAGDTFLPRIWQAGRIEGEQIGIPWYLTPASRWPTNDLLRRAGYSARPPPLAGGSRLR